MSLSAEDVKLRLPSDGTYWAKEEPVTTPYFNVWDTSMAKVGKSISFLPSHLSSHGDRDSEIQNATPASEHVSPGSTRTVDISTIGSFAYCIEATESLNRIGKFFLQRPVDCQSHEEFSAWLTRFKELDLQLIHWKMFLPQRWKDSNISKEPTFVHMDPNLTLAHITHNTSMILLHQCIAYPRANLVEKLRLASVASAETCQRAASETANIVQKYLQYTPFVGIVNAQFSFCAFVSARVILVHAHLHHTDTPEGYDILSSSLQQMSARWVSTNPNLRPTSEAKSFAENLLFQLQGLRGRCNGSPNFKVDALGYAAEVNWALGLQEPSKDLGDSQWLEERRAQQRHSIIPVSGRRSHYMSSGSSREAGQHSPHNHTYTPHGPPPGSPNAGVRGSGSQTLVQFEANPSYAMPPAVRPQAVAEATFNDLFPSTQPNLPLGGGMDNFASLSNVLLDPQYVDMDRVISFQDTFIQ